MTTPRVILDHALRALIYLGAALVLGVAIGIAVSQIGDVDTAAISGPLALAAVGDLVLVLLLWFARIAGSVGSGQRTPPLFRRR